MHIVILGLSLSSSWGNGHATTYRSLIKGLDHEGHDVLFLERDVGWYAQHRDLPEPDYCRLELYDSLADLDARFGAALRSADAVMIGSYVPDGVDVVDTVHRLGPKRLCFYDIDTPVTLAALRRREEKHLARRQVPLFDIFFSFAAGPALDMVESEFGAKRAAALYCSVDEHRYMNTGEPKEWDLGYLGTYSEDRQPTLQRLLLEPALQLPERRFVVAGSSYPSSIDWPANVERIEHLAPSDHASFYSRQRFTLNVTRQDMRALGWAPSVRLFEAAACCTPIISDDWEGLREIFSNGEGIAVAHSADDVVRLLWEGDRAEAARVAHRIVRQHHTGAARAGELVTQLHGIPERRNRSILQHA